VSELLVIEDDAVFAQLVSRALRERGHAVRVAATAEAGLAEARSRPPDLVLLDLRLPGRSGLETLEALRRQDPPLGVVTLSPHGSVRDAVAAMRRGADDCLELPADAATVSEAVEAALEARRAQAAQRGTRGSSEPAPRPFLGEDPRLRSILRQVERLREARLAPGDRPAILISGETGTGKGHLAEVVHAMLGGGPFIEIDCSALPIDGPGPGPFEAAEGGTLLLDEVGELPHPLQARLLGAIERRASRRAGGARPIAAHVMASSQHDLVVAAAAGRFRPDLLHRLRALTFALPPLRERGDDVIALARHFCDELARSYLRERIEITADAEALLRSQAWPGNVRELRHAIERALLFEPGSTLGAEALTQVLPQAPSPANEAPLGELPDGGLDLGGMERALLARALEKSGGNQTRAAQLLGLSRYTFRYRLKKWGLDRVPERSEEVNVD
jgi:DNA-binding NtrC family response regulator